MFQDEMDDVYGWHQEARAEEAQERSIRLNALCRVYEQADRVLTGDPVLVHVASNGPAPAWSDGASITINAEEINDMDLETLTQVTGLNYHELCHHLYTPRKGTDLVKKVLEEDLMQSFNILEDQRIETLFVARFPSVAPFLTATVARWLGEDRESMPGNYLCIRGRRYLPVEVRQAFRDAFAFPDLIPAIIEIVDEYRTLHFPKDYGRAIELVRRLNTEVLKPMGIDSTFDGGPSSCGGREPVSKGRPEPGKAQEKDANRAKSMGVKEPVYVPRPKPQPTQTSSTSDPSDQAEESTAESSKPGDGEGQPVVFVPQSVQDAIEMRDEAVNSQASPTAGVGHVDSVGGIPKLLDDTIENVLNRKDVQADIKAKQKVIVGGDGKHEDTIKRGKFDSTAVPQEAIVSYRRFAKELQRLRDDAEPTWSKETPSGRLNVQRVIRGCEIDNAFDRWDEGDDGCDIEAVILIDRSGSMSSGQNDRKASIACWTIKRALEHIDAPVTVYAFDDKPEVAYKRTEKAGKTDYKFIYGNGGTEPYPALLVAEQLLMASRKKNKMLFVITDGVFNKEKNDELIERINKRGILTVLTLIAEDRDLEWIERHGQTEDDLRHGAEIYGRVRSAGDLLPFARKVVVGAIKKRGR
jgi:Mg-chelatase subunit ChlD